MAHARTVVDQINAGQGTVGKLIKDDTLYRETTGSMSNLNQILTKMNTGQGTIGKVVNDQEFYKNAKLSLQKLDKATESLEDTGPLELVRHGDQHAILKTPQHRQMATGLLDLSLNRL